METESPVQAHAHLDARIGRHHAELVAFLARRAPLDAEELAQETWLRVARAAPDCADDRTFRAYAYTVARRLLVDHHRRRRARVSLVPLEGGLDPSGGHGPDDALAAGQALAVVEEALAAMGSDTAEVFRLRVTGDLSFKEIAGQQGVPLNTALGRMHNATRKIRAALVAAGLLTEETP